MRNLRHGSGSGHAHPRRRPRQHLWTRSVAATAGLALIAAASVACGSGSNGGSTDQASPANTASPAATSTATSKPGSGGSSDQQKVTIEFMEAMGSGSLKTAMEHLTNEFEKANPNITVTLVEEPDYGTLNNKIKAAASAGKPPTIAQVYPDWAATLANSKVIVPLDTYASTSSQLKSFYAGIRKDLYLADGQLWMWPFNKSTVITYYNTEMLQKKNLAVPKTWAQFAEVAKKVSGNGVTALSIDPGNSTTPAGGTQLYEILCQAFGIPAWDDKGQPQFNSPAAVKALQYLVDLKDAGALAIGTNYPGQVALGAQKGTFDLSSVASYYYNAQAVGKKFTMGTAPLPKGPHGNANQMAGTNIVLFDKATDAQKQAAWKYMQFLDQPEQQAYWSKTSGYLPVTPQALKLMSGYTKTHPYVKFASKALSWAVDLPPYASITATQGDLAVALQSALTGKASPKDALDSAQQQALAHAKSAH